MEEYMADNAAVTETLPDQPVEDIAPAEEPAAITVEDSAAAVDQETPPSEEEARPTGRRGKAPSDQTRAFAQRVKEMSRREVDSFVAGMGLVNEFTGQPIATRQDYDDFKAMQQAQKRGEDPVLSARLAAMQSQLAGYRVREQDERLAADPDRGEAYKALRQEVLDLVRYCHQNGRPEVDVQAAFQVLLSHNLGRVLGDQKQKTEQQAIRRMTAQDKATPGSLRGGSTPPTSYETMSDADFAKQVELAKRGGLSKR